MYKDLKQNLANLGQGDVTMRQTLYDVDEHTHLQLIFA